MRIVMAGMEPSVEISELCRQEGIDQEHLALNEISALANTSRGHDEVSQSGVRIGSYKHLETVRAAACNEQCGSGKDSLEAIATKCLSSQLKLGNYTSFTDAFIFARHSSLTGIHAWDSADGTAGISFQDAVKIRKDQGFNGMNIISCFPSDLTKPLTESHHQIRHESFAYSPVHEQLTRKNNDEATTCDSGSRVACSNQLAGQNASTERGQQSQR